MKIEVELVSRETIKPSSPTPDHLRHHTLSFLDQVAPPVFMPLLFFYPKDKLSNAHKSNHLKTYLSESLTKFYPLAGRVAADNLHVDCNDEGVPYAEAQVGCGVFQLVSDPIPGELNKLLPCELDDVRDLPMAVQTNFFSCGGVAVSVVISHKVADALSSSMFINCWAAAARGDSDIPVPKFDSSSLFPPRDVSGFKPSTGIIKDNIVTKRFVFTPSKIASLRDNYTNTDNRNGTRPTRATRVEALSAFLWSRFKASTQANVDPNKTYTLLHAVNLRPRIDPPLTEHHFGNICYRVIAAPPTDTAADCRGIVNMVREAIREVDGDYIMSLKEGEKHLNFLRERAAKFNKGEMVSFSCTSLCRFPLYEADFGWGKPIWVGSASMPFKNLVVLMDAQSGDGIEAWVNLKEDDMAKFEVDKELLAFVLPPNNYVS